MGLAERRAVKAFQDNKYPKLKTDIDAAAGFDVVITVDWDTITAVAEGYPEQLEENLPKVFFRPLLEAIKGICIDDLGKEALKEGLKKVAISGSSTYQYPTFEYGVLTLNYTVVSYADDWLGKRGEIQTALEKGL
jgi:hypothetical protein